jgi:hypothetical protein
MRSFSLATALLVVTSLALGADENPPSPVAPPEPEGMQPLFNGKDLEGWDGDPRLWSFRDGIVRGETTAENPTQGNTFLIWRGGTVQDFELRLSFRIRSGNSGVQYRSKQIESRNPSNRWVVSGYQAEVENTPGKVGFLYHERGRGYLCRVGEKVVIGEDGKPQVVGTLGDRDAIAATYKKSDWNDYIIIARGNHLRHYLNGYQTVDLVDNDPQGRALQGLIALQIHAGPPMVVEFKDVRLKQSPRE